MSSKIFKLTVLLLLSAAASLLGGCLSMQVPEKFLTLEDGWFEIKAITPDEAQLWARSFSGPSDGAFPFWGEALKSDFIQNRGYALIEERQVKSQSGQEGLELLFEVTAQGQAHRYLAVLYVYDGWLWDTIVVGEFVAPKSLFDGYLSSVRQAYATID
ncbi:MAG: hypothetical protein HY717_12340 [Planctomycetes bacterium]|nr:hypothetical protein [Planctomycetota bacterium]